jgi:predicted enzyme related to lactoylglutathione lyase
MDSRRRALQGPGSQYLGPLHGRGWVFDNRVMGEDLTPSAFRPGDVTYLRIPCSEPLRAADFYEKVFAWKLRRDDDEPAFADASGHVIGHFVGGEPPQQPGIVPYVYVDDLPHAITLITASGGSITEQPRPEGTLRVASFRDSEGNVVGIWTETAA